MLSASHATANRFLLMLFAALGLPDVSEFYGPFAHMTSEKFLILCPIPLTLTLLSKTTFVPLFAFWGDPADVICVNACSLE